MLGDGLGRSGDDLESLWQSKSNIFAFILTLGTLWDALGMMFDRFL